MAKLFPIIAVLFFSFTMSSVLNAQSDVALVKSARSYLDNKDWDKAITAYKSLIEKDKYNGAFYNNLATAYYNAKKYSDAIKNYEAAISTGYQNDLASYNIACCYALTGDEDNAVKWLKETAKYKFKNIESSVAKDGDFDKIRNNEKFKNFLAHTVDKTSSRNEVWQADIKFLKERMEQTHYNVFNTLTKEKWEKEFADLLDNIDNLDNEQITTGIAKIIASVGDGHTLLFPYPKTGNKSEEYKVKFYKFKDGLYIKGIAKEYTQYNGMKVTKIGKYNTDDALKIVSEIIPHDNEFGIDWLLPNYLVNNDYMYGLGISDSKDMLKLELAGENGKKINAEIKKTVTEFKANQHIAKGEDLIYVNEGAVNPLPLYLKHGNDWFWFEHLKDINYVYMQVNAIQNKESEKLKDFYDRVFRYIDSNNVEGIIIDLRLNSGGNNGLNKYLINNFIRNDRINQKGKVFTIIGRNTFSAAMNLVSDLENNTQTIFIGEPTGSKPNFVGEINTIDLPNTGLKVSASSMYWQKGNSTDMRKWVFPEIYTPLSFSDFKNNVDPAMNAVYEYVKYLRGN
ncbi:MAG: tetratricopeptide repeat protein [Ignavibacteria bacterium]|nr:tetratricopeptide repeat protein [Ignavibacteria bacterium]